MASIHNRQIFAKYTNYGNVTFSMLTSKVDINVNLEYCHRWPGLTVQFTVIDKPRQKLSKAVIGYLVFLIHIQEVSYLCFCPENRCRD